MLVEFVLVGFSVDSLDAIRLGSQLQTIQTTTTTTTMIYNDCTRSDRVLRKAHTQNLYTHIPNDGISTPEPKGELCLNAIVPGTREVLARLIGDHIIACRRSVVTSRSHLGSLTRTLRSEVSLRVVELHAMFKVRRMRRLVVYMHECTLDFRQLLNLDLQSLSYVVRLLP